MKKIFILSLLTLPAAVFSQVYTADSSIKVIYTDTSQNEKSPAFILNGTFIGNPMMNLDPKVIEDISVFKADTVVNNKQYYGKIFIRTKQDYNPKPITLTALKEKYTNVNKKPSVFMIDGEAVIADNDEYIVDENNVFQIIVEDIKNQKEKLDFTLIKILTKTDENINKSKAVRLREN